MMIELKNEILDAYKRIASLQVLINQEIDVTHRLMEKLVTKCVKTEKGEE